MTRTFKTKAKAEGYLQEDNMFLSEYDGSQCAGHNSFKLEHCSNGECLQGVAFRKYWRRN